jgi:MFS family permease
MSTAKIRFLIFSSLIQIGIFIAITFTNLYLWDLTNSFPIILRFNLSVFLGMALGSLFSGVLGERMKGKYIFSLGSILFILQLLSLIVLDSQVIAFLHQVGMLSGLALGCYYFATADVVQMINSQEAEARNKFSALRTSHTNFLLLLSIPALSLLISRSNSFIPVFIVGVILFSAAFMLSFFLSGDREKTSQFRLLDSLVNISRFADLKSFLKANFLTGLQEGLYWVFLGIVTLELFGNILNWGIFLGLLYLLAIITSSFFARISYAVSRRAIYMGLTLIFAFATIILSQNWNLTSFIIYQVVLIIMGAIVASDFGDYLADIVNENEEIHELRNEYNAVGEFFSALGKLVAVAFLIFLDVQELDALSLRMGFLAVAPIPFLVISTLSKTRVLRSEV